MNHRTKGVGRELRAMKRRGRETPESLRQRFGGERAGFGESTIAQLLGEQRGARNCGGASAAEKTDLRDAALFHTNRQLKNIAADRVADFDDGIGRGKFAGIARIAEMIEDGVAKHREKVSQPTGWTATETGSEPEQTEQRRIGVARCCSRRRGPR